MKKLMAMLLLAGSIQGVYAQKTEKKEMFLENKSLYEELTNVQKKTDKFNLYLNMQGSFDANFRDGFDEGVFKMRQLRIEAKGNLNSWLSYRYRQRLNRSNEGGGMIDNIPTSIDYAGIGVKLNDQFSFFAGKQCTAYGGFEFDLNPIDIYQYSDMIEKQAEKLGIVQDILLEVNIGGEAAKSGFAPEAVEAAAAHAKELAHVRVRGLMTIPPAGAARDENMVYFEKVHALYVDINRKMYNNGLDYLSMGMSGDFADAIRAGSNMVRVGTAIFGARDYTK